MNLKQINNKLTDFCLFLTRQKLLFTAVVFAFFIGLTFASPLTTLQGSIQALCGTIKGIVPVIAFIMLVLAGVIYAAGQVMGAETRARANVWSTAMLVGAIIGLLIVALAPTIINLFGAGQVSTSGGGPNSC